MQIVMDNYLAIAWLACGIVIGYVLSLLFGPIHTRRQAARAKQELAQSQQRRSLERLRQQHQDLTQQLEAADRRHEQAVASLKRTHTAQLRAMAEESNRMLTRPGGLGGGQDDGDNVISGTSFEVTRFTGDA